jgi:hypothetical protein
MSIIGAAAPYWSDVPIAPLANSTVALPASTISSPALPGRHDGRDPAIRIDLSDKVKSILARASSDQDVADRLKAFVDAHRIDIDDGSQQDTSSSDQDSSTDIKLAFEQLSGGGPAADASQDFQVTPGFDGTSFLDHRFSSTGEFSGFSDVGTNVAVQAYRRGNKEYITVSESEVAATSVAASSDAGQVSATSTGTHTQSLTFAVNFKTGAISVTQSEFTSISTAVKIGQPISSFSTFA